MKTEKQRILEMAKQLKGKELTKVELQIVELFINDTDYELKLDDNGNICALLIK